ncbi:hypothetical protein LJR219_004330 [Phenylobacterium sp. LjRoot219]|uniref:hypothetical protein n=1 Tax=Phenylobacterium sp. LjRoot219 TaxID=3342283 RepID=UPI003ECCA992
MDEERRRRWKAHCERMAEATYTIADWCEDPEMIGAYLELAAKWFQLAERGPGGPTFTAHLRTGHSG